jgi:hypothetical protein
MNAIEFRRISFGCNRRRTCEKTETSEEKAVKEDLEKTRPLTQGKLQGEYWYKTRRNRKASTAGNY